MAERPRDRLGRPLPPGTEGFPGVTPRDHIGGDETVSVANSYLDEGLPFHAHEILELRWRCCPEVERPLWRGLAQAAAGATHRARGNAEGDRRLAMRARETLAGYDGPMPVGADELIGRLLR